MRIRTLLTLGVGAAVGASVTYLGDPDHGRERRREARRWVMTRGREQAASAASRGVEAARAYAGAALEGYRESRDQPLPPATATSDDRFESTR